MSDRTMISELPTSKYQPPNSNISMNIQNIQSPPTPQIPHHLQNHNGGQNLQPIQGQTSDDTYKQTQNQNYQSQFGQPVNQYNNNSFQQPNGINDESRTNIPNDQMFTIRNNIQSSQHATSLPSRDIPMGTLNHMHDNEIKPNFIPSNTTKKVSFVEDEQEKYKQKDSSFTRTKHRLSIMDSIIENSHIPIILAILYFIFQLPYTQKKGFQLFPYLHIKENQLSIVGLMFKSVAYGLSYMGVHYVLTDIADK